MACLTTVGVVTSGGDAPGMNAAIRAITRIGSTGGFSIVGFQRGWEGLIVNSGQLLTPRSVGGIIQLGGTILLTSRCTEFRTEEGLRKAAETLRANDVDALIVIGGSGSLKGAHDLSKYTDTRILVIPATIDNDVYGSDETIGFDTAVNTGMAEIDKIRDTAISHERIFIVELMGRTRGFLAATVGLTIGAEIILVPEVPVNRRSILKTLMENSRKGKKSSIIVAAEGVGDNMKLAHDIEKTTKSEVRLSILGYAQRGGSPTARSRLLANLFAKEAIDLVSDGKRGLLIGFQRGEIVNVPLEKSARNEKHLDLGLLKLAQELAT
jgi:6-phosphofructokinase 1